MCSVRSCWFCTLILVHILLKRNNQRAQNYYIYIFILENAAALGEGRCIYRFEFYTDDFVLFKFIQLVTFGCWAFYVALHKKKYHIGQNV